MSGRAAPAAAVPGGSRTSSGSSSSSANSSSAMRTLRRRCISSSIGCCTSCTRQVQVEVSHSGSKGEGARIGRQAAGSPEQHTAAAASATAEQAEQRIRGVPCGPLSACRPHRTGTAPVWPLLLPRPARGRARGAGVAYGPRQSGGRARRRRWLGPGLCGKRCRSAAAVIATAVTVCTCVAYCWPHLGWLPRCRCLHEMRVSEPRQYEEQQAGRGSPIDECGRRRRTFGHESIWPRAFQQAAAAAAALVAL